MRRPAPLSPALMVAGANALAALRSSVGDEFTGELLRRCGRMAGPWHTAFVHHVGFSAHYDADTGYSSWPLPATADCVELARMAHEMGIVRFEPAPGDILLLWSRRESRFVRSGIVVGVRRAASRVDDDCFNCLTVEGATTANGDWIGSGVHLVARRVRPEDGHRFIRWADLDGAEAPDHSVAARETCIGRMMILR